MLTTSYFREITVHSSELLFEVWDQVSLTVTLTKFQGVLGLGLCCGLNVWTVISSHDKIPFQAWWLLSDFEWNHHFFVSGSKDWQVWCFHGSWHRWVEQIKLLIWIADWVLILKKIKISSNTLMLTLLIYQSRWRNWWWRPASDMLSHCRGGLTKRTRSDLHRHRHLCFYHHHYHSYK